MVASLKLLKTDAEAEEFLATTRNAGYPLTDAEGKRVVKFIRSQTSPDLGFDLMDGLFQGWDFIQKFFASWIKGEDFDWKNLKENSSDSFSSTKDSADHRRLTERLHSIRDGLAQMGGNIAPAAAAIAGDISHGTPVMAGNLADIGRRNIPSAPPAEGTRLDQHAKGVQPQLYAVADTSDIQLHPAPQGLQATRTLT